MNAKHILIAGQTNRLLDNDLQSHLTSQPLIFRRSTFEKWLAIGVLILLVPSAAVTMLSVVPKMTWETDRMPIENVSRIFLGSFIFAAAISLSAVAAYFAGPRDLELDASRHIYRFRRGFPFISKWFEGNFDDIASFVVSRAAQKAVRFEVQLCWRNTAARRLNDLGDGPVATRRNYVIATVNRREDAEMTASKLAHQTGISFSTTNAAQEEAGRDPMMRRWSRLGLLGILVCVLPSSVICPFAVQLALNDSGSITVGRIVGVERKSSTRLKYEYQANGRHFTATNTVRADIGAKLKPGAPLEVTYGPQYPATSRTDFDISCKLAVVRIVGIGLHLVLILTVSKIIGRQRQAIS